MARKAMTIFLLVLLVLTALGCGKQPENKAVVASPAPTAEPTEVPTEKPTETPTQAPTKAPTEAPTEEPTATPTEEPTPSPTATPTAKPSYTKEPTEATFIVSCKDQNGEPVAGVVITFCTDSICMPTRTGENGTASFTGEPYPYEVHVASVPAGYTLSGGDTLTASQWGDSLNFSFIKDEPID